MMMMIMMMMMNLYHQLHYKVNLTDKVTKDNVVKRLRKTRVWQGVKKRYKYMSMSEFLFEQFIEYSIFNLDAEDMH